MLDLIFLKTFCTLGSRSTLVVIGLSSIKSNYWMMISALCIHALLCVGRQLCLFYELKNFLHLAVATLFMIQAVLAFPFGRTPFNSENKSAYALTKLSILSVIIINLFALLYSMMVAQEACSSTFCFSPDVAIHSAICAIMFARLYQYQSGLIDTGVFNICGCASNSGSTGASTGASVAYSVGAQTRAQSAAQKTD